MMKFLGITLTLLGAFFFYCQHSNQNLLSQTLSPIFKTLAILCLIAGLLSLMMGIPVLVACLVWLIILTVMWSLLPFLRLFEKELKG